MTPRVQHTCEIIRVREDPTNGDEGIELHAVRCGACGAMNVFDESRYNPEHLAVRKVEESIIDSDTRLINVRQWYEVEGKSFDTEPEAVRFAEAVFTNRRRGIR